MVLERHDDLVIRDVTSPITGIQRTCKFPPSIAEVVEFIEEHVRSATFTSNYDARSRCQLVEREQYERQGKTETQEHRNAVAERIKGELRVKGFKFEGDTKPAEQTFKRFSAEELTAMYGKPSG